MTEPHGCLVTLPCPRQLIRQPLCVRRRFVCRSLPSWTVVLVATAALLFGTPAKAQDPAIGPNDIQAMTPPAANLPNESDADLALPAVPDGYVIGSNDLLSVFVYKMPDFSRQVRVAANGSIRLPLLSQPLAAAGKTANQVAGEISRALVAQQLAVAPTVQVIVRQVLSHPIVVSGAVKSPMVIQASRPMRLLEVLARTGGLGNAAGTTVLLTRETPVGSVTETINLTQLTQTTDSKQNPLLKGGEVVRVLPARMVYAVGAFQKPGAFPVRSGQPVTVLEAIALAQGFSTNSPADKKHAEIIRSTPDGSHIDIPIDINKMLKHQNPDKLLEAGDILYVPDNGKHKALMSALNDASQILIIGIGYNATHIF